jgi:hypothetical protein
MYAALLDRVLDHAALQALWVLIMEAFVRKLHVRDMNQT